jgi:hypothetical protein
VSARRIRAPNVLEQGGLEQRDNDGPSCTAGSMAFTTRSTPMWRQRPGVRCAGERQRNGVGVVAVDRFGSSQREGVAPSRRSGAGLVPSATDVLPTGHDVLGPAGSLGGRNCVDRLDVPGAVCDCDERTPPAGASVAYRFEDANAELELQVPGRVVAEAR